MFYRFRKKYLKDLDIQAHLKDEGWKINADKEQGPGITINFLEVLWLHRMNTISEKFIEKILEQPMLGSVKEVTFFFFQFLEHENFHTRLSFV